MDALKAVEKTIYLVGVGIIELNSVVILLLMQSRVWSVGGEV